MEVEEIRGGRAWRLWEDGREVGVVLRARVRSSRPLWSAYSARDGRHRWDLGASTDWGKTLAKGARFDPPAPGVAVRVLAEVTDKRL